MLIKENTPKRLVDLCKNTFSKTVCKKKYFMEIYFISEGLHKSNPKQQNINPKLVWVIYI